MNEIRTFADQLRDQLKTCENDSKKTKSHNRTYDNTPRKVRSKSSSERKADDFFKEIRDFKIEITQKSMIRMDDKTMNLLKHIKLCKDIDMNKFIVYCLHKYLDQHPWLSEHIRETLKNITL